MFAIFGMVLPVVLSTLTVPSHRASDVVLIANWLYGNDPEHAFDKSFGDSKYITDNKDSLLYTDIAGVEVPVGLKAANYEFIRARMSAIKHGHRLAPAVLIVRSSLEEPADEEKVAHEVRNVTGRVYYIEVAIGNLAWHWIKVVVRDEGGKPKVDVLWTKTS